MEKFSGYSLKSNPCRNSNKKNHIGLRFNVGFTFFVCTKVSIERDKIYLVN